MMADAGLSGTEYNSRFRELLDETMEAVHEEAPKALAAGEKEG